MELFTIALSTGGIAVVLYLMRQYAKGGVCKTKQRIDGKTVVITGGNGGIGKECAIDLARRGGKVIIACRDMKRAQEAVRDITSAAGVSDNMVSVVELDLTSFKSVRACAEKLNRELKQLDILINNAGIMFTPYKKTEDGNEAQFQVNHLSHFLLTNLLMDKIKAAPSARIVTVSSIGHTWGVINFDDINSEKSYDKYGAYFQSKLANVLFAKEHAKRLKGTNITTYSLHPGSVMTDLGRDMPILNTAIGKKIIYFFLQVFFKTPEEGAQTSVYCAIDPALANESGKYYSDCKETKPQPLALDEALAEKLWRASEKMVGLAS